jgi:hypothetical protein
MNIQDISIVQILSIAGSTFAFGLVLGWVLALLHSGGSSSSSHNHDEED